MSNHHTQRTSTSKKPSGTTTMLATGLSRIGGMGSGTAAPSASRHASHHPSGTQGTRTAPRTTTARPTALRQQFGSLLEVPQSGNTHGSSSTRHLTARPRLATVYESTGGSRPVTLQLSTAGSHTHSTTHRTSNEPPRSSARPTSMAMVPFAAPDNASRRSMAPVQSSARDTTRQSGGRSLAGPSPSSGGGIESLTYEFSYMKVTYSGSERRH
ncbi:Nn.00g113110.m01.CDS01 [Neocucurbitaria sp. VM-36]